jgi:CRP/FNR family transcriptional regulator
MELTGPIAEQALHDLFVQDGRRLKFRKGEIIMGRGGYDYAFYMLSGFVRSYSINNRGDEYTHILFGPDDIFPTFRIFEHGTQVYFEALNDAEAIRLPRQVIRDLVPKDNAITYALLRKALKAARVYTNRIRNLEFRYASERIIFRLMLLCERFGESQEDGTCMVRVPLSQQILASTVNVSRESVNRTLEQLKQKGIIVYNSQYFHVLDVAGLEKQLGMALDSENNQSPAV